MKVVVVGATGNVGTAVVRALTADDRVSEMVGIARRAPRVGAAQDDVCDGRRRR
ncbi:Semialdehyde dehydrogenase, NAD binding domain [Blastococcus mobilis]|uniref:Semialdehyde dehydrogenase, NAD binding domain n=1 Tax=Blastococcus mobilis TaxID=1938746 RepID=A0A239A9L5_9ACTN|nr:Semialdehyde dehydrogenase, NAD binding domain [Blastococcus mobilis]